MKRIMVALTLIMSASWYLSAQEIDIDAPDEKYDYINVLTDNTGSVGKIYVNQDPRMAALMEKAQASARGNVQTTQVAGWRVQVFSSNQQGTAKAQADEVKEQLARRYRNLPIYVTWMSPFWKVRVGDCVSNEEAQALREDLKESFPAYANEIYVVKDKINVQE